MLALRHDGHEPQPEELPVTDLTSFASLPLDELTAELERMLAVHHAPARRYAARQLSTLATSSEITSLPACTDRVVVSTFSTETNA